MASFKQLELADARRRVRAKKLKLCAAAFVRAYADHQKAEEAHRRLYEQHKAKYTSL